MAWHLRHSGGRGRSRNRSSLGAILSSNGSSSGNGSGGSRISSRLSSRLVVRAFPRNVASLGTLVADLTGRAQWATVGGGAITRDMALYESISRMKFNNLMTRIELTSLPQA